jgi:DNA-binding NtrC family response regulator
MISRVQCVYMAFMTGAERALAETVARLAYENPFLPERISLERGALGDAFVETAPIWAARVDRAVQNPNVERLQARVEALAETLRARLVDGTDASAADRALYEDVILYLLYGRYADDWYHMIVAPRAERVACWEPFRRDAEAWLRPAAPASFDVRETAHLFATLFQIRRAFHHIFWDLIGGSMPMARLRAAAWQSIFTHDLRRYRRALWNRMNDVTTLVVGPSGTGKELVARAIACSRYIPFDPKTGCFAALFTDTFHPLNLSALAPTLVESELFGHRRGAFTGALQDRAGWLEQCTPFGSVFLDEIGDVDPGIQVKLLRVLQSRSFERLGDTAARRFHGKVIAATNRDLAGEIQAGRFRADFYYRLCADMITTPSLAEQLRDAPGELATLVLFLARRIVGEDEAVGLAREVETWIACHLGPGYAWPGNVRELEQCLRNVMIRGEYRPQELRAYAEGRARLARECTTGALTADELLTRYCTLVYAETQSYVETARRLGLDRRTVKARVDLAQVDAYRA